MPDLTSLLGDDDISGVVPGQLDARVVRAIGAAFADIVVRPDAAKGAGDCDERPAVVVGRDLRPSGRELVDAFADGLNARGVDAVLIGPCSTGALAHASGSLEVPGAMVTGGDRDVQVSGLTFLRSGARPVRRDSGLAAVLDLAEQNLATAAPDADARARGRLSERDPLTSYATALRELVDLTGIRPLKIVVDAGGGIGARTVPAVLGAAAGLPALPLEVIPLHFELAGASSCQAVSPLEPAGLRDLRAVVVEHGADLGIAVDARGDRYALVDETGEPVGPAVMAALVGLREVEREREAGNAPIVVLDPLMSCAVADLLTASGATVVRTGPGAAAITAEMAARGAVFGADHGGHYYHRDLYRADCGLLAVMHVLASLGGHRAPLSALAEAYQPYAASGEIGSRLDDVAAVGAARDRVVAAYVTDRGGGPVVVDGLDGLDGLTIRHWEESPRWWFNLRADGTELRLSVEAADEDVMEKVRDDVLALVRAGRQGPRRSAPRLDKKE